MPRTKVTPELSEQIMAMRRDGKDANTIAAHFGLGRSTVQRVFTQANRGQLGKPYKPNPRVVHSTKTESSELQQRVVALRSQGYTYPEIAKLTGISKQKAAYHRYRAQQLAERNLKASPFKAAKGAVNGTDHESGSERNIDTHVSYVFGRTEAYIEHYADGAGISREALTQQLVELLRRKARW